MKTTPLTLTLALILTGCAASPNTALENRLASLPPSSTANSSTAALSLSQLRHNSAAPDSIVVRPGAPAPMLQDFEKPLITLRQPLTADDGQAIRSLSYHVNQSLLSQCSQLCGFQINPAIGQGVAGQLMTFTCGDQTFSLREYLPGDGKTGFSLSQDRVNLLINDQPGWLQRVADLSGKGSSFLAWEGADRGYALFTPSPSDEAARRLVELANSLPVANAGTKP